MGKRMKFGVFRQVFINFHIIFRIINLVYNKTKEQGWFS